MVLRVRRAVRRFVYPEESAFTGAQTQAGWNRLMADLHHRERSDAEQRMADIERELNKLGLN